MNLVIRDLNKLRSQYLVNQNIQEIISGIFDSTLVSIKPAINLAKDLFENNDYKRVFSEKDSKWFVGLYNCSYSPNLSLEGFKYELVQPSIGFDEIFLKTPTKAIKILEGSMGIQDKSIVALFPENLESKKIVGEDDSIFYLVDRFTKRHIEKTREAINSYIVSDYFNDLNNLSSEKIEELVSNWVHLHEYFHRTGSLPIPQCLKIKSSKFSASLEELRVDLLSIKHCLNSHNLNLRLTAKFILAERLLGYLFFRNLDTDFDALSSQIFCHFLRENGVLNINNKIHLKLNNIQEMVDKLILKIEMIEKVTLSQSNQRSYLVSEIKKLCPNDFFIRKIKNIRKDYERIK